MSSAWLVLVLILGFVTQCWASLDVVEDENFFVEGSIIPADR